MYVDKSRRIFFIFSGVDFLKTLAVQGFSCYRFCINQHKNKPILFKDKPSFTCEQKTPKIAGKPMKKAIAYYRASTKRQGQSGLGLEAQQQAVSAFSAANGYQIIAEYVELESGARNGRNWLNVALAECKQHQAVLLIAKLDRLSRRVTFIAGLIETKIDFKAIDIPNADPFTLHIFAAFAEKERVENSIRTINALAAAKARGVILGKFGRYVLSVRNRERAKSFAEKMRPIIQRLRKHGIKTVRDITEELNRLRIPTYRQQNAQWHVSSVHRLLVRIDNP